MATNAPKTFADTTVETTTIQKDSNEYVGIAQNDVSKKIKTSNLMTKDNVGLGNVDNTSDINKPISTAVQNALDTKETIANVDALKGAGWVDETVKGNADDIASLEQDKADKSTTYTQTEVNNLLSAKADNTDLATTNGNVASNASNIATLDTNKQDKAITIDGQATTVESAISLALSRQDVVLDNKVVNGDFRNGTDNWNTLNTTSFTVTDNKLTAITDGTAFARAIYQQLNDVSGKNHITLKITFDFNCAVILRESLTSGTIYASSGQLSAGTYFINIQGDCLTNNPFLYITNYTADVTTITIEEVQNYTLTDIFGEGNEPTADEMKALLAVIGYVSEEYIVTNLDIVNWVLSLIRENRTQIVALGGSF